MHYGKQKYNRYENKWSTAIKIRIRRLVTANRSRLSIRVKKFLASAGGVVNPVKLFFSSSFDHNEKFSCCVSHRVGEIWGDGAPLPWNMDRAYPDETCSSSTCYRAEFGSSRSNRMDIRRGPKTSGNPAPLGWSIADPLEMRPSPTCVTFQL